MSRVLLPHIDDHEFELCTDDLIALINDLFVGYDTASHNANEWQQGTYHSRLDGVLYTLDAICALSTNNIRDFMVSCTNAEYLPFGYTRFRT